MATHSQGAFAKMLIEPGAAPHTFDANSIAVEFIQETMSKHGRHGGNQGIRGTLEHESARIREMTYFAHGSVLQYVSPNDIANLMGNVFGLNESPSGTFTVDDDLPYFGMLIDTDYETWEFTDCKCASWMLRSRAPSFNERGEPDMVYLQWNVIASTVVKGTTWPVTPPSLGTATADTPYAFADSDSGITIAGSARAVEEMVMLVDNDLKAKYTNSLGPHSHRARDRRIMLNFKMPWNSDNDSVYGQAVAGAAGSIVFTNSGMSTTFTLGKYQVPDRSPFVRGKRQIPLILEGEVRGNGATSSLVVVNDNTP